MVIMGWTMLTIHRCSGVRNRESEAKQASFYFTIIQWIPIYLSRKKDLNRKGIINAFLEPVFYVY